MASSLIGAIRVFKREENAGQLTFVQEVKLYTSPDNPTINPLTGHLLVGAQPIIIKTAHTLENPRLPSPAQVLHFEVNDDGTLSEIKELYLNDGSVLCSSSVASLYDNKMLIGTVVHKLLLCEARTLYKASLAVATVVAEKISPSDSSGEVSQKVISSPLLQ